MTNTHMCSAPTLILITSAMVGGGYCFVIVSGKIVLSFNPASNFCGKVACHFQEVNTYKTQVIVKQLKHVTNMLCVHYSLEDLFSGQLLLLIRTCVVLYICTCNIS